MNEILSYAYTCFHSYIYTFIHLCVRTFINTMLVLGLLVSRVITYSLSRYASNVSNRKDKAIINGRE